MFLFYKQTSAVGEVWESENLNKSDKKIIRQNFASSTS